MATHGKARTATIRALRNREPFQRSGFNMRGIEGKTSLSGYLDTELFIQYENSDVVYTVLSYRTPIAWVTVSGTVVIPDVRYSVTTSHHQGLCRAYL